MHFSCYQLTIPENIFINKGTENVLSLLKKPPGVFRFVTLTLEVPKKKSFNPLKFCDTPWKFQGQKPRPMQIHMIFL